MSQPATKRKRIGDALTISRSDIWYQDGSVILQAEATQFRVHWGILAHSSFFRDMQALPQPPEQPTVEGCPIVELHDAVEDDNHLLAVLYDTTILFQKSLPLAVVAALLRLGRKYEFRKILDAAVQLVIGAVRVDDSAPILGNDSALILELLNRGRITRIVNRAESSRIVESTLEPIKKRFAIMVHFNSGLRLHFLVTLLNHSLFSVSRQAAAPAFLQLG